VNGGYAVHNGRPRNPLGRQGLAGRGDLAKWGPNQAADPVVVATDPETGSRHLLLIRRADTRQWALPGGMVDPGEHVSKTARRELKEETGVDLGNTAGVVIYEGYVDDPRNTDEAWMETTARLFRVNHALQEHAGSDAADAHWFDCGSLQELKAAVRRLDQDYGEQAQPLYASHELIIAQALQHI
jgi:ADP-ribose pyrophosphatase